MGRKKPPHLNLALASRDKTLDLVGLIEKSVDVNSPDANGITPLHAALWYRSKLIVIRALVAKGANLEAQDNQYLRTPLHLAFHQKAPVMVIRFLIKFSENVNITDVWKRTALHAAIETDRHYGILTMLIKKGANMEALDDRGRTPLHVAFDTPRPSGWFLIPSILKVTKNVNSTDSELKRTVLHSAIEGGVCNAEIIRIFVEKGANVDAQDGQGRIPLHSAFDFFHKSFYFKLGNSFTKEMINTFVLLIKNTSDLNVQDYNNKTPLYYAFFRQYCPAVIRALVENGADFNCPDSAAFRLACDEEGLPLLTKTFPKGLKHLKTIVVSQQTTLYDALVLRRPHDWNCVDRPLECLTERNKPFWSVIMTSIVTQRSYSLRLHSEGIRLDEESTLHVISFLPSYDVINLLLAHRHCLHLKRRTDSSVSSITKRQKKRKV